MNERNYRKYSQEFKLEALELLQRGERSMNSRSLAHSAARQSNLL